MCYNKRIEYRCDFRVAPKEVVCGQEKAGIGGHEFSSNFHGLLFSRLGIYISVDEGYLKVRRNGC